MRVHQLYIKECVSVVWATRDYYEVDRQGEPTCDLDQVFKSEERLLVAKRSLDEIKSMLVQPHYYWYSLSVDPRRNSLKRDDSIWQWISMDALSPHRDWEWHLIESRSRAFNRPKSLAFPAEETIRAVHQSVKRVRLFDGMEQPLFALCPPSTAILANWVRDAVRVIKKEPTSERRVE